MSKIKNHFFHGLKTISTAGLIAGAFDILGAIIVYSVVMQVTTDIKILKGIGRAAFGASIFHDGVSLSLYGLFIHFVIAFSFSAFYFFIYPYISFAKKQRLLSGFLYGIFVWCVMNLIILPLFHISDIPSNWTVIIRGALILMICVGLPVSIIINKYYRLRDSFNRSSAD
jgi:uncharacterized membrane protein YagU involved in acid resistance